MNRHATSVVSSLLVAWMATSRLAPAEEQLTPDDARAEEPSTVTAVETAPPSDGYGFTTALSSRYVFRGQPYSSGPVSQSTAWLQWGRFSFYVWNNVLLDQEPLQRRVNEVDLGVAYAHEIGALTLTPAIDHYRYRTVGPLDDPPTLEASLNATWTLGSVDVFSQPIVDLKSARGAFFLRSGVAHERRLGESVTVSAELTVGWASARYNDFYLGVDEAAFHHAGIDLSFQHRISESLSLTYQVGWTHILDAGLRRGTEAPDVPRFGVTLGFDVN